MKFFIALSLLVTTNVFASELNLDCKKLINGNANGKSYTTGKSVDFNLKIDTDREDANVQGTMVTKAGKYHQENGVEYINTYFTDGRKFKKQGDIITVTSFDRNLWLCNLSQSPCRTWESLSYNTKTKEGTLEKSHSYSSVLGDEISSLSIKFSCDKV